MVSKVFVSPVTLSQVYTSGSPLLLYATMPLLSPACDVRSSDGTKGKYTPSSPSI
ncbi:hypothetical protein [Methanolacinia petrolearia]|uniref:hypothetical protein n=1 Tax=Methanolacinia petrolearia TaxID=54120 RepID=UPI003BA87919